MILALNPRINERCKDVFSGGGRTVVADNSCPSLRSQSRERQEVTTP